MKGVLLIQLFVLLCIETCEELVHFEEVNLTHIIDLYDDFCGKTKCNNKREEKSNDQNVSFKDRICPNCSCRVSCFITGNCCPDVFFEYEPACIETNVLSWNRQTKSSNAIQMLVKCPTDSNEQLSKLCNISSDLETQLQNIPVTSRQSGLTFRNIYCLMCFNESLEYAIPWSLEIDCEEEGNLNFITNYSQIIKLVNRNKCDIFFYTSSFKNYTRSCKLKEDIVSTCNVSGTWKNYDFNIEYACQAYDNNFCMFKNIYCYMCNPSQKSNVITGSNITECISSITTLSISHEQFHRTFSVQNLHNFNKDSSYKTKVFDPNKNKYRNIMCYPGRVLTSDGCVPLLRTTRNLGYIVSLGLTTKLASDINETVPFLESVKEAFRNYLKSLIDIRKVNFTSSIYWANPNCAENIIWQSDTEFYISVYQKILILDYVDRLKVEQKLMSIYNSNLVVAHDLKNFTFKIFKNVEALSIESYSSTMGFVKSCFIREMKEDSFVYSNVNSLLTCQQIELEITEFSLNSLKLTILAKTIELDYDKFMIMSSGRPRICMETFRYIFIVTQKPTSDHDVREIIHVIFTCTSLVCLVMTFITYCIFPSLRTLPGKNNMCLVFAIFQCHLFFQLVSFGAETQKVCMIIGALLHYFWLAIFSCLNVCSFHMYRVFTSKTVSSTSENKRLTIYIVYSYGIPLVIVLSNILFTYLFSERISIGYGSEMCFLDHDVSFIYTFVVPISIVCCTNLFFFIVSSFHIKRLTIEDEGQNEYNRMHTIIYLKLFLFTCIIWIYQIVNTFLPMSEFSTVMTVLNDLHGIFIFWSFICNRRILDLYVKRRFRFRMHVNLTDSRNQPKLSSTSIELNTISIQKRNQ